MPVRLDTHTAVVHGQHEVVNPASGLRLLVDVLRLLLDPRAARETGVALPVPKPVDAQRNGADEPEQDVCEEDPDGVLHALDASIPLGVFVDVHGPEDTKGHDPEDEDDDVPDPDEGDAEDEGDHGDQGRDGRDSTDGDCVCLRREY